MSYSYNSNIIIKQSNNQIIMHEMEQVHLVASAAAGSLSERPGRDQACTGDSLGMGMGMGCKIFSVLYFNINMCNIAMLDS